MPLKLEQLKLTEAWAFDLDNTLYCSRTNLFDQIDLRMKSFIAEFLDIESSEAYKIQKRYFRQYGTTLRGLMERHAINPKSFLDYVHDIDLQVLQPDLGLNRALKKLPGRKIIFTNADVGHSVRVLEHLGISQHFEDVFDIVASNYIPKPQLKAYEMFISKYGLNPRFTVMFEDMARNLKPASDIGMTTAWVRTNTHWGQEDSKGEHVHYVIDNLSTWLNNVSSSY